jgi:hypothetical protein
MRSRLTLFRSQPIRCRRLNRLWLPLRTQSKQKPLSILFVERLTFEVRIEHRRRLGGSRDVPGFL